MDDYSMSSLGESKNEWCARLVNILTPAVIDGLKSIFKEALELCEENDELDKYLMTFQTFLSRIPKWNDSIIGEERVRIETFTKCGYLEELITCVHVIQLKALTCVRVGQKQKKIDIDIPSADVFIHKVYINVARKLYTNVYLFEAELAPLDLQKNNRQLELFAQESILNTIRDTMPVESILRAYMDETEEEEVDIKEEIIEEAVQEEAVQEEAVNENSLPIASEPVTGAPALGAPALGVAPMSDVNMIMNDTVLETMQSIPSQTENISFSNTDKAQDTLGNETLVSAPKTIERLEQIALDGAQKRRDEEPDDDDEDDDYEERITIGGNVNIDTLDINDMNAPSSRPPIVLDDIEFL
tara:strand:- start:3837 stop:4907 length:1071 start_codon:yes stop_codon:yes gene_type:complete